PEAAWYVETRTLRSPAASCRGFSTHVSGIVQQFGFARIPSCSATRSPFTSGTTSGTPGSSRYADDLSIATAPPRTTCGTSSRDASVPTEKSATSMSPAASASAVASSTTVPSASVDPADRAEAKARTLSKPRSRRIRIATLPTAPVAPITATRASRICALLGVDPELVVNRLHGALDLGRAYDAGDADRRRGDDLDVDACLREGFEHASGDSRVALHSGSDERDLRDLVVEVNGRRADVGGELLEDRLGDCEVALRQRERDIRRAVGGDVLHDHVDVHAGVRKRAKDARRDARAVGHRDDRRLRFGRIVRDA